ncbi:Uncharacterised protein [Mycobacteroides abscessus subsp. abscessus]|nr:Uncharacterised protein [Mycobacteroides abscessus subsp. abscessus]
MAERLAGRGKPGPLGRLLKQRMRCIGVQEARLLVVAVSVNHDVRATQRTRRVDRVE